jgi:tetratricopeptide (TPR) repeat protein
MEMFFRVSFWLSLVLAAAPLSAKTFLVIPLFNLSGSQNLDWIGESVAETVLSAAGSGTAVVLDRDDREEAYRTLGLRPGAQLTLASVIKLGQTLGADRVFFGTFRVTPPAPELTVAGTPAEPKNRPRGTLTLSARMLDLAQMREGSEFSEVGPLEDLGVMQQKLAWRALKVLDPTLAGEEDTFLKDHPRIRVDALESYIRGLLARTPTEQEKLFERSASLDPAFTQPAFELGRMYWNRQQFSLAAQWLAKVPATAAHGHEARFLLGLSRYEMGDAAGAERALTDVTAEVPIGDVFNDLGAAQLLAGDAEKAEASFAQALKDDPSDPVYQFNIAYALYKKSDCSAATPHLEAVLKRDSSDKDAAMLLDRCRSEAGPAGVKTGNLARIKTNFEESAYRQLQDVFQTKRK